MPNPSGSGQGSGKFFNTPDLVAGQGTGPQAGDLRRKYNFGDRVSELAIAQTPFFRFLSMVGKNPTNDPEFKSLEYRHQWQRRWVFAKAYGSAYTTSQGDGDIAALSTAGAFANDDLDQGDTLVLGVVSDYTNTGKVAPAGQDSLLGTAGTTPIYLLQNQLLRVPITQWDNSHAKKDEGYIIVKVTAAPSVNDTNSAVGVIPAYGNALTCKIVKGESFSMAATDYITLGGTDGAGSITMGDSVGADSTRIQIVGTAYAEGSGYPETWSDQVSDIYGYTQIWKTAMKMNNTARATVLRGMPNEWARVWKEKLIEHKMDIEFDLLFGHKHKDSSAADPVRYTQGAVDFVLASGNVFGLDHASADFDGFVDDMGTFLDPRTNTDNATIFMCDTATYNWLNKVGSGSFVHNTMSVAGDSNSMGRYNANFDISGRKSVLGVNVTSIATVHGNMNLVRNVMLDGSGVKILGLNMKQVKYRPLVGNGLNRDTSVYVGVQTLENTGIDSRVDLILTEAGLEWGMPECHAIWK
tara:strand:+ start:11399 stop:12970 length:1572 start_codon:yes stop_codon:yes gene_type:complete